MSAAPEYGYDPPEYDPPRSTIGPHTVEDWLELDPAPDGSTIELIMGHLFVTPTPSLGHQRLSRRIERLVEDALATAGRTDLEVLATVNIEISSTIRTALIPDVVVLSDGRNGVFAPAEDLSLVVEIWSPGNTLAERETKAASYALAGVPFFWALDQPSKLNPLRLTAHRLENGLYKAENTLETEGPQTITAAPVPITLDLADLVR
ncbi:Uma2 family endonuclease [Saccharothrix variisporea]|uniref:Putative restriction endonuclease n=1 Tax=Saccharothrix variisporea TaxID=543527 RepID=A0A495XCB1_9PSEU|nr:Uma2 family endonuclease [Saccharothrix variisporea]RKT72141.1 putative restriction endonuclease [Saccharothrix variisporea]